MAMTPEESYAAALAAEPAASDLVTDPSATIEPAEPIEAPAATEAPKLNPNWEEAWKDVPEPIRELQRPYFEKWDANYNALQARHTPYAQYEQRGYNPEYIAQAIDIQQSLAADPEGFIQQVAEHFGVSFQQAADAVQQSQEEAFLTPEEQRIRALEERQEAIAQNFAARQQAEEDYQRQQQYVGQITGALGNLRSKYGEFNEEQVVRWAAMNATTGKNPDLEVALNEIRAYEAEVLQRNARTAPRVLGAAGGIAAFSSPPEPKKLMTNDELLAKAMAMGAQLTQGQ